jgi:hypothetical protein
MKERLLQGTRTRSLRKVRNRLYAACEVTLAVFGRPRPSSTLPFCFPRFCRILGVLGILCIAGCAAPQAGRACPLDPVAKAPLEIVRGLPVVEAQIAGAPVRLLVDTGAVRSLLSESAAARLRLPRDPWVGTRVVGVGGLSSAWDAVTGAIVLGGAELPEPEMAVAHLPLPLHADGVLGADIWRRFDADLDLPARKLTLYRAARCQRSAPPWPEPAIAIAALGWAPPERLMLPAALEGLPAAAVFDTGAQISAVSKRLAMRIPAPADGWRALRVSGVNAGVSVVQARRFARLQVGPFLYLNAVLPVLELPPNPGTVLVGVDMLRGCRTWFSFTARQVFVATRSRDVLACRLMGK